MKHDQTDLSVDSSFVCLEHEGPCDRAVGLCVTKKVFKQCHCSNCFVSVKQECGIKKGSDPHKLPSFKQVLPSCCNQAAKKLFSPGPFVFEIKRCIKAFVKGSVYSCTSTCVTLCCICSQAPNS